MRVKKLGKKFFVKKGEMSSKMLVTIILLVMGFGIILLIYSQLSFSDTINREVCRQSVVFRGTLPSTLGLQDSVPLKCQTNKICVRGKKSFDKGECEEFTNADAVTNNDVDDLGQVERLISQEIVECWSMMGEGKVPLFSQYLAGTYGIGDVYPTCVICSRIAFDKPSLLEKGVDIEERDILNYMLTHKIPGQEKSYYDYLVGEGPAKFSVQESISIPFINNSGEVSIENSDEIVFETSEETFEETKELAILFMQISAPTKMEALGNIGEMIGIGTGSSVVATKGAVIPWVWKGAKVACGGPIRAAICGAIAVLAVGVQQYSTEDNRNIAATRCGDVSIGNDAKRGCSVVRAVNYDVESIRQYCSVIESIP